MATELKQFSLESQGRDDIHDITGEVRKIVGSSKISSGTVNIHVPHSTAAITTIEYESGAVSDLKETIRELIPEGRGYKHDRIDNNAHSHLRAALIGPSVTLPFKDKELILGTWQQIVLCDFDIGPRTRKIVCQIVGD